MVFHQGCKVTKRVVSGEADLLLGVQGNQQGCLVKVVFHQGQGNQEGVPCKTDLSSCVNGNQEGVPREGGLSSGVKANHEECPS